MLLLDMYTVVAVNLFSLLLITLHHQTSDHTLTHSKQWELVNLMDFRKATK